ncbi:hypothetical protein ACQJBY_059158 [Aegilops geniculata]
MANWFPMALKEGARTWLLNLAPGTISSWDQMRTRFIANFQGTHDRPPVVSDMRRIKQQPGETLQKYIQRFNSARLKIPRVSEEAIISAFSDGVCDVKMKEELAMHEDLCTSLELFNLATKCARAEEGRLSLLELPAADPEEKKPKAKDVKRKGAAVLAAEPDTKRGKDLPESSRGSRYCVYHDLHTHNTDECQELRAVREGRVGRRPDRADRGYGRGGGRNPGRWEDRGPCPGWRDQPREDHWRDQPREDRWRDPPHEGDWRDQPREDRPHGNPGLPPLPPQPRRNEYRHQDEGAGGFQKPRAIACILGGAQAPASQRIFKQFAREVNAVLPKLEATRPLRWSACTITFSSADQLKCATTAGVLPMLCSPVISNVLFTRTLIDGGARLNVLSVETFNSLQVPYD